LIGEAYGGGNEAPMDGTINLDMRCISGLSEVYGGARAADIDGDVELNITCGTFNRVFGGNNMGGNINGTITVNVEETGCNPVVIGELYGCGNAAAYSGNNPTVNVISCTRIGSVFGGGYGAEAVVTGNPAVNVRQVPGRWAARIDANADGNPDNNAQQLGTITNVFGGGNAAMVDGNTNVSVTSANISGNVYGGGNNAEVTGNTNVVIGTPVGE
ncbi:MAG: hypothetical protein IJV13_08765, partial [Prevotella sp.]|nr:hypothetical protein [Prevotella sp.]